MSKKKISLLLMRLYEIKKKFGLITESDLIRIARENKINLYELIAKKENKKFKILKREEEGRGRRRKKAKTEKRNKQRKKIKGKKELKNDMATNKFTT